MKYVKMLGLLAVAAAALMAFAGSAGAVTLTSPAGTTYTSTISATSTNSELHGAFVSVKCTHSKADGKVEQHGAGKEAGGKISSLTFTGCNYPVTVTSGGHLTIHANNTVTSTGAIIHIHTSVGTCTFTTGSTTVGTLTEGAGATLDINSAKIPRTGGNFLCGASGTWTGSYKVNTPAFLEVD